MVELANIEQENLKMLIPKEKLLERVDEISNEISEKYKNDDEDLMLLGVLNGACMFTVDIAKRLELKDYPFIDFIKISSYGKGTESNRRPKVGPIPDDVRGKRIIVVEDIVDTGHSMRAALQEIEKKGPLVCSVLPKP
jgi:hypoxanthine phosphoribosyltransferase